MERIERIQKQARNNLPWLPKCFTVTEVTNEYVMGWIKNSRDFIVLRHLCEKHTRCNFISRYVKRPAQRAKLLNKTQRIYLRMSSIPVNKHPFTLNKINTYTCVYKDTHAVKVPDHKRKKKLRMDLIKKVDCPARIIVKHLTIFEGYTLPKKPSLCQKRNIIKELKSQLETDPDVIPSSNWCFVRLPLVPAHCFHKIPLPHEPIQSTITNKRIQLLQEVPTIPFSDSNLDIPSNENKAISPVACIEESFNLNLMKHEAEDLIIPALKHEDILAYTDPSLNEKCNGESPPVVIKASMSSNLYYHSLYDTSEGSVKIVEADFDCGTTTSHRILEVSESPIDHSPLSHQPPVISVSLDDVKDTALKKIIKTTTQDTRYSRDRQRRKNLRLGNMNIDASINILKSIKKLLPLYLKQDELDDDGDKVVNKLVSSRSSLSVLHDKLQEAKYTGYINENQKLQEEYFRRLKILQSLTRKRYKDKKNKSVSHSSGSQTSENFELTEYPFL